MYGFNGQYPGPLLRVAQGAEVVDFSNALDQPTTVHWHGIRLDNRFDGVPELTQEPVPPGGRFIYRLRFPDAGSTGTNLHVREDTQQDLGLFGNIRPLAARGLLHAGASRGSADAGRPPRRRRRPGTVRREATTHALMGRFGNVFLVNGEPRYELAAWRGEVVRFLLTNVSNTRTSSTSRSRRPDEGRGKRREQLRARGVGRERGDCAERYIVAARFEVPGAVALVNRVQALDHLTGASSTRLTR